MLTLYLASLVSTLVFWSRFLQKIVWYPRIHEISKLITVIMKTYAPFCSLVYWKQGGSSFYLLFYFRVTWYWKSSNIFTPHLRKCDSRIKCTTPHLSRVKAGIFTHKYQDKPLCHQNAHLLLQRAVEGTWPWKKKKHKSKEKVIQQHIFSLLR